MLFIFICALKLSLISSSHKFFLKKFPKIPKIQKRNLADSNNKLMLVGFGNYNGSTFNIYFKNYNNSFSYDGYLSTAISYTNGQNVTNINCTIDKVEEDNIIYICPSEKLNATLGVKINGDYTFYYKNGTEIKNELINSSFSEASEDNILSRKAPLDFLTFYFDSILVSGNTSTIKGNSYKEIAKKNYTLNSTVESYKCNVTVSEIKFNLKNTVKEHLIGKMLYNDSYEPKILIFSNETVNDLLAYSNYTNSKVELLGYDNYTGPTKNTNASNRVHLRGSFDKLKKYLRFTARIKTSSRLILRFLEQYTNVNATGIRTDESSDLNNGHIVYDVTFENTTNLNILGIENLMDFNFSDDNSSYSTYKSIQVTDITRGHSNPMAEGEVEYQPFNLTEKSPNINTSGTSFSFNINIQNDSSLSSEHNVNLSYASNVDNTENETDQCSLEKKSANVYNLKCSPKYDIYTKFSSLFIEILLNSRLRLLQSDGNILQLYPANDLDGNINFKYVPNVRDYKADKKGLSGGAITAIVLSTVAVIAALGAIIFFLNRKEPQAKPEINKNFQDSSANINN